MRLSFTLNQYDDEGDMWDECILLHIEGDTTIIRLKNIKDLEEMIEKLNSIKKEILGEI